eukprot:gene26070-34082_t
MFSKKALLFCLLLVSFLGNAQSFTLTLANPTSDATTFEVDLLLTVPTGGKRVASVTCGLNFDAAILNGGTPSTLASNATPVAGTSWILMPGTIAPEFLLNGGLNSITTTYRGPGFPHLRIVQISKNPNQMDLAAGTYRVGRFKFTNTVSWTTNSNANLWISSVNNNPVAGSQAAQVGHAPFGSSASPVTMTTITSPAVILTHIVTNKLSVPLNTVAPCPTAATASNLVAESPCAGAANGSATITLTGAPSPTGTVSYSVDGGAAVTGVSLTASAFTVNGLSAGSHVVSVTYAGCTATPVSTLSFTIGAGTPNTTNGSVTTSICDGQTYLWAANGTSYTTPQSGTTFVSGCNIATLNLTVNPVTTTGSVTTSICDGQTYVWPANGQSYTTAQSGITVITGCNTATLNLSITPATTTGSVTTSICEGATYVWPANGQSYTTAQSGITVVTGCNTATLNLSITPTTTTGSVTTSICDGATYVWPANGQSYTTAQSGVTVITGCNTATLNLSITPATTTGSVTTSICDATLNLSITPATTTGSVTTSICDGQTYVWPANGQSYTTAQSGVTVITGCNTATLNLSITPLTTTGSESVTACGTSYTWSVSGQTYNASGVYPFVSGCNTATLTLTLNTSAITYYADTDGDGFGFGTGTPSCTGQTAGTSVNNTDCAPADPLKWRTANFFVDADGDGYNNGFPAAPVCYGTSTPAGYVAVNNGTDCNDNSATVNSNASEIAGNEIDDNYANISDFLMR